jgi:glucose-1-phosphate cytidylyltransferase
MTGGRLRRLAKHIGKETFLMTYGDGLSNVNLKSLIKFHKKNKKLVTLTAVRPPARFGALKLKGQHVSSFKEKSHLDEGWINGGFFVMEPEFLKSIKNDNTYLEREPLEKMTKKKQLIAFRHKGFWQCMDTKRDKDNLEKTLRSEKIKF